MSRSTSLIALFGAAVLVVAVGAAVLRGADGGDASDDPTVASTTAETPSEVATTEEPTTPAPTTPAPTVTDPTATDAPTDATPTGEATTPDTDGTAGPDEGGVGGEGTDDDGATGGGEGTDDDDDGEGGVAMGPTDEVQDTPNTGGGALTVLGALVAAGAVATGRRRHG